MSVFLKWLTSETKRFESPTPTSGPVAVLFTPREMLLNNETGCARRERVLIAA
jgi:hypothetical protein